MHQGWPLSTSFPAIPAPSPQQHDAEGKRNWRQQKAPKIYEQKAHWSVEDCDVENTHVTAGYSGAITLGHLKNGPAVKGEMTSTVTAAQSYGKQVLLIWLLQRCESVQRCVQLQGRSEEKIKKWRLREETGTNNYFILQNRQLGVENLKTEAKQQRGLDKVKIGFGL